MLSVKSDLSSTSNFSDAIDSTPINDASPVKLRKDELTVGVYGHELKWWSQSKVKTTLIAAEVDVASVDKKKGDMYAFVTFPSLEAKLAGQAAIVRLTDKKGKTCFRVKEVEKGTSAKVDKREQWKTESKESYRKRHASEQEKKENEDNAEKKAKVDKMERTIEDQVTPCWRVPYEEQLKSKQADMEKVVRKWIFEMKKFAPELIVEAPEFLISPTIPSPIIEGYRNKCTFAIGADGKGSYVVGFTLGRFGTEESHMAAPDNCLHIPEIAKRCASLMTTFVKSHISELSVYDKESHEGFWRMLQVRNTHREVMITVQFHPDFAPPELQARVFEEMIRYWREAFDSPSFELPFSLVSLQVQAWGGLSNAAPDDLATKLLYGSEFITQRLLGLDFRISSNSFFQVNTPATEALYSLAGDWAGLTPQTLLLDVCCGAGSIGLTLANRVSKVIGFEVVPDAVEDAKANAIRNGVTNASYLCGKAEDTLRKVVEGLGEEQHVVAIVDPPRAGLHFEVVNALRKCRLINTIIFIMCNPSQCLENMKRFLGPRSKSVRTSPFVMTKAVPVDLFPHTKLTELVVMLERKNCVSSEFTSGNTLA